MPHFFFLPCFVYSYTENLPENFGKNNEKSALPVNVRRSKTPLLKLPYSCQNEHFIQNNKATDIFIHYNFCQSNLTPV